jgi:hypothetical protein
MLVGKNIVSDEQGRDQMNDINDNFGAVTYIMLGRIYDMLVLIADAVGKGEDALQLINLHSQGQLMAPPPSLMLEDENDKE